MADNLVSRFTALLTQEQYRVDRELEESLGNLWSDLAGKGTYHSSVNVFLTKQRFESDIEARSATVVTIAARVLARARLRDVREQKGEIARVAADWLRSHIDSVQERLLDHAGKLRMNVQRSQLDLGRDRVLAALSAEFDLLSSSETAPIAPAESFIDPVRLEEIAGLGPANFDVSRLVRLCEELNICFRHRCFHGVAFITRAVLDHIPPLFGCRSFSEVANNYSGGKSFKEVATHLESASRKVSDGLLHTPVRKSESLPTLAQVDVRQQLDTVLAEAVRISHVA